MSQGSSIFSSSNGTNGEAPANPFASLAAGSAKSAEASPFAAVTPVESESPFGFAAEESAPERAQAKLPEKRAQAPSPQEEENPFLSAGHAEATPAAPAPALSPFSSEATFEAPAKPAARQETQGLGAAANPLSAPAPERAPEPAPVRLEHPSAAPAPQSAHSAPQSSAGFGSQAAPAAAAVAASSPALAGQSTRQLELRAIFGSEGEMGRDEMLTRAKGLPGIREVTVVGPGEISAVQTIGDVMARFGFGGSGSWQMTCSGGVIDFISSENTTLAVLREGRYSAGVWETLMIVARELGKLS